MNQEFVTWHGVWRSGPDAGAVLPLPLGRHLVGRAHTAGVRCDDQTLQPHHALIEVGEDGTVRLTQLTGRTPVRVDGRPIDQQATARAVELTNGSVIEVGISSLVIVANHSEPQAAAQVRADAVVRAARAVPEYSPA